MSIKCARSDSRPTIVSLSGGSVSPATGTRPKGMTYRGLTGRFSGERPSCVTSFPCESIRQFSPSGASDAKKLPEGRCLIIIYLMESDVFRMAHLSLSAAPFGSLGSPNAGQHGKRRDILRTGASAMERPIARAKVFRRARGQGRGTALRPRRRPPLPPGRYAAPPPSRSPLPPAGPAPR